MTTLSKYRIRLPLDTHSHAAVNCSLQESTPLIWRGVDVNIEVGLYTNGSFVTDVSNIDQLILNIHSINGRNLAPLVQKTLTATGGDINTITEENWDTGTSTYTHGTFELDHDDTFFDMTGANSNKLQFWMVVHAELDSGEYVTLGSTVLTVEEDATQLGLTAVGASNPYVRAQPSGQLQLKNEDTGQWHTIWVKGAAGQEFIVIGEGEA